jgi:hypothetical protein
MLESNTLAQDRSASVEAPNTSKIPWRVIEVCALPDYQLFVRFADGTEGRVEMREQIFSDHAGVFASLRDPQVFAQVGLDLGAVTWANGLDIAPDATYDDIRKDGVQVLR